MKIARLWAVVMVLALTAGLAVAALDTPNAEVGPDLATPALKFGGRWSAPLLPQFEAAAKRHDVPLPLLLTLGYFGSAFENRGDAPTIEGGYGVMALRQNAMGANSLADAASLTRVSEAQLKVHAPSNINACAAVLAAYGKQMGIDPSQGLEAWLAPVIAFAGLDEENSRLFAMEVYEKLLTGLDFTNSSGERFFFEPQDIGSIDLSDLRPADLYASQEEIDALWAASSAEDFDWDSLAVGVLSTDYGPAVWDPAPTCNYNAYYTSKDTVVIHTIEGTAAGARSWMKNCNSNVTSHYVVSEAGGVWQMVREQYRAWHVGCLNSRSVGIENEGYAGSSSHPTSLYNACGLLTRDICNSWGITKAHRSCPPGILGHKDANVCVCGGTHWDPGSGWNWSYFIGVVQGSPPPPTWAASYKAQSKPSTMVAGSTATAWVEYTNTGTGTWTHDKTRLGTSSPQDRVSPFYNSANWVNNKRPTDVDQSSVGKGAVGRFSFVLKAPTTPGSYTEKYKLVQEGVTWFGSEISWAITVTASTGNISGTVRSSVTNAVVSGATVSVTGKSTTTNSSGVYTLSGLKPGTYTVTVSKAAYVTQTASVSVTTGTTTTKNFTLVPTDTTVPSVPTGLTAYAASPTRINLSWTASTDNVGVTGYKIFRGTTQIGTSATTSYADASCTAATAYTYKVAAYDAMGNTSAQSAAASETTPPAEIIIDNPAATLTGVWTTSTSSTDKYGADYAYAATATTEGKTATWRPNLAFGGTYTVYTWYSAGTNRATNAPFFVQWETGSQNIAVNQQVSGGAWVQLVASKQFAIGTDGYVKLHNGTGATGSIVVADAVRFHTVTTDTVPPSTPTNLAATAVSGDQINLTWTGSSDNIAIGGYNIYRNNVLIDTSNTAAYSDMNVDSSTTYSYQVAAFDTAGNVSARSNTATVGTPDTIAPSAPTDLAATAASNTQANLTWTAATDNVAVTGYKVYRDSVQIATSATTSYSDTNCAAGISYIYEVSAYDAAGNESDLSDSAEITMPGGDNIPPSVPTITLANGSSASTIDLAWSTSEDNIEVTGYKIYRGGVYVGSTDMTSYTDTGLAQLTTYTYEVSAYDEAGNESGRSAPMSGTTLDGIPPSVPTGLTAQAISETQVNVSWNASTDNVAVTRYRIYRDGEEVGLSTSTTYSDTTCIPGGTFSFQVAAEDADNNLSALSSPVSVSTPDNEDPSVPTNLDATAISDTQVDLTWTASTDNGAVAGYKIYRNTVQIGTSATASYSDTTCVSAQTYSYTVSAYDLAGNESAQSTADSVTTPDTVPPSVPTGLAATAVSGTQINLTWTAPTDNVGVVGYKIYRGGVYKGTSATTSYSDSTCSSATTYSYTVTAYDAANNESGMSNTATAKTFDTVAPSAPTGLTATAASTTRINLAWNASTDNVGVVGYRIFRDGEEMGTSTTTSYQDTECQPYTTYSYQVFAYDLAGNTSAGSNVVNGTSQAITDFIMDNDTAVFSGSWFTGTSSTDKYGSDYRYITSQATQTATATWTPNINIPGYYTVSCWYPHGTNRSARAPYTVQWDGSSQTVNVNQQLGGGVWLTLVSNKRFQAGTEGYVRLGNGTGETALSIMADAVRFLLVSSDLTAPSVPTNLAATAASATQINLTWTAATDNVAVTGYNIYRNGVKIGTSATTSYSSTGLTQMTTYTYTVAAYDAMGNTSAQSTAAGATTWDGQAPSVPTGLSISIVGPRRVRLTWTNSTDNVGVTGYNVYRNGVFLTTSVDNICESGFLTPSTTYTYTVSAYDARGNTSAQCAPVTKTTPAYSNIIIDNPAATFSGVWTTATSSTDKYGTNYAYASTATTEGKSATFRPNIVYSGEYTIYAWWCVGTNRATNTPYFCQWNGGSQTVAVNQTINGGAWRTILTGKSFLAGTAGYVKIHNGTGSTGKIVVADGVRFQQTNGI